LVSVEFLPQAAELLQHQVDQRLEGIAKASVATRLALILSARPEGREGIGGHSRDEADAFARRLDRPAKPHRGAGARRRPDFRSRYGQGGETSGVAPMATD
jgi:hypothetical protein